MLKWILKKGTLFSRTKCLLVCSILQIRCFTFDFAFMLTTNNPYLFRVTNLFSLQIDCLVCSCCFRFIGSIELQIGRKLYLQGLGSQTHCSDMVSSDGSDMDDHLLDSQNCSSSSSRNNSQLPTETVESLMHEKLALPYSNEFPLPSVINCPGGCKEVYYCRCVSL